VQRESTKRKCKYHSWICNGLKICPYARLTDEATSGSKMDRLDISKGSPNQFDSVSDSFATTELRMNDEKKLIPPMMKAADNIEVTYLQENGIKVSLKTAFA
jgi:hypothetical protein